MSIFLYALLLGIFPLPILAEEFIDLGFPKRHKGRFECPNGESSAMPNLGNDIWWVSYKLDETSPQGNRIKTYNIKLNPELSIANTTLWMGNKVIIEKDNPSLLREHVLNIEEYYEDESLIKSNGIKKFTSNKIELQAKDNQQPDRFGNIVLTYKITFENKEGKEFSLYYKGFGTTIDGLYLKDAAGKDYRLYAFRPSIADPDDMDRGVPSFEKKVSLSCVGIKNQPNYSKIGLKQRQDVFLTTFNKYEEGYANGAFNAVPIVLEHHFIFDTIKFKGNYQEPSF